MDVSKIETESKQLQYNASELEQANEIILIKSNVELITFLGDILDIDLRNYDSQSDLKRSNKSFDMLYEILSVFLKNHQPITAIVEKFYVDRFYRDSYYLYYASKLRTYSRFCKRVFLFYGEVDIHTSTDRTLEKNFMGSLVIRPLYNKEIGRSLLNPYFFANRKSYLRFATYKVVVLTRELRIHAFPFSMQDSETTTCAEITILNLIDYFSTKYQDYKIAFPSDIYEIVDRLGYERGIPTKGLDYPEISRVFSEIGFFPRLYSIYSFQDVLHFKRVMHYYIESGIPAAVGLQLSEPHEDLFHSITCIGHGAIDKRCLLSRTLISYNGKDENIPIWYLNSADFYVDYVVMDDGKQPYANYSWKLETGKKYNTNIVDKKTYSFDGTHPQYLMVPLSKRMFLEAEDACDLFLDNLSRTDFGIQAKTGLNIGSKDNPFVMRMFLASSRHFRQFRVKDLKKKGSPFSLSYASTLFPKFVWVCEIYTIDSYLSKEPEVLAELVIDATAAKDDYSNVIIYNYGKVIKVTNTLALENEMGGIGFSKGSPDGTDDEYFYSTDIPVKLKPYCHNLQSPHKS